MNKPLEASVPSSPALAAAANVRIARIETIALKVKLDRDAIGSNLKFTHRHAIVTRVHTDAGIVGECFNGNDDDLQGAIIRVIADEMAPRWWQAPPTAPMPKRCCRGAIRSSAS